MNNKERFLELCSRIKRSGIEDLVKFLEGTDFFYAPASTRFHGAYPGGLLEHSLNVYDELMRLIKAYPDIQAKISEESIIIVSLFHDVCKAGLYTIEKRNRKNAAGQWESYDAYTTDEIFHYGSHGGKSVYIVQSFIKLAQEEAVSIANHMGSYENQKCGEAFENFPLAWLVHAADESATYIIESKKG